MKKTNNNKIKYSLKENPFDHYKNVSRDSKDDGG